MYDCSWLSRGKGSGFFMDCTLGTTTGGDPENPDKTFLFRQEYVA
jgi:hypothetical protein